MLTARARWERASHGGEVRRSCGLQGGTRMKVRKAVLVGGVAAALVMLGACGGVGSVEDTDRSGSPATAFQGIGQPARHGDLEVTVHGIKDPFDAGNPVVKAPPGSRQVAVEVEVKN